MRFPLVLAAVSAEIDPGAGIEEIIQVLCAAADAIDAGAPIVAPGSEPGEARRHDRA